MWQAMNPAIPKFMFQVSKTTITKTLTDRVELIHSDFPDNSPEVVQSETSESTCLADEPGSIKSKCKKHGPLYPDSFSENGQVKVLSESEKTALLEGQ